MSDLKASILDACVRSLGMMFGRAYVSPLQWSLQGLYVNVIQLLVCTAAAYTTVFDCVKATIRTNGFKGPFQGLGATLVRNAPANSIYLGSFEVMKDQMAKYRECKKTELPAAWVITAGGLGGLLYWLAIYPVDVIKSAMATDSIEPSKRKYPDMATTYKVGKSIHTAWLPECPCLVMPCSMTRPADRTCIQSCFALLSIAYVLRRVVHSCC